MDKHITYFWKKEVVEKQLYSQMHMGTLWNMMQTFSAKQVLRNICAYAPDFFENHSCYV